MNTPIFAWLTGDAAVSALIAARIHRSGRAPQDVAKPYVTWSTIGGHVENYTSGSPGIEQALVQIDCWSLSESECAQLARAVVAVLQEHGYQSGVAEDSFEDDTKLYRVMLQFHVWNSL